MGLGGSYHDFATCATFEIKDRSSMRASCKIRYAYIYRYFAAMVPQPILLFEAGNSVRMLKCLKPSMLAVFHASNMRSWLILLKSAQKRAGPKRSGRSLQRLEAWSLRPRRQNAAVLLEGDQAIYEFNWKCSLLPGSLSDSALIHVQ